MYGRELIMNLSKFVDMVMLEQVVEVSLRHDLSDEQKIKLIRFIVEY